MRFNGRIIFMKSQVVLGKKKPVGTVIVATPEKAKEYLNLGHQEYTGPFPPQQKHKWNLSQLKK